ncbi:MAG: NGG1p interacting factor NIF3, partial [Terriglobia bacterium]
EKLAGDEKKNFDTDRLENPYSDSRILFGDPNHEVKRVLVGIDMEVPEVLLADRLSERGTKIDLILAHHPEGKALATLSNVMGLQADVWASQGVPINVGDALMGKRSGEVFRSLQPVNHNRAVDAARLLGFAFMCIHTPADNLVTSFLQKKIDKTNPYVVDDVMKLLRKIPEYKHASENGAAPFVLVGNGDARAGKVLVDMTGGTQGPEEALEKLASAGVGTLVGMHLRENLRKKAEANQLNVVLAGHIASDAVGFNLFLDEIEGEGVEIIACSGFRRVSRRS